MEEVCGVDLMLVQRGLLSLWRLLFVRLYCSRVDWTWHVDGVPLKLLVCVSILWKVCGCVWKIQYLIEDFLTECYSKYFKTVCVQDQNYIHCFWIGVFGPRKSTKCECGLSLIMVEWVFLNVNFNTKNSLSNSWRIGDVGGVKFFFWCCLLSL